VFWLKKGVKLKYIQLEQNKTGSCYCRKLGW